MRTRTLAIATFVALALGAGTPVLAQAPTPPAAKKNDKRDTNKDGVLSEDELRQSREQYRQQYHDKFKAADKNNDGGLTKDELRASRAFPGMEKNFDAIDANKDGKVTLDERRAWGQTQQSARKGTTTPTTRSTPSSSTGGGGLLPPR